MSERQTKMEPNMVVLPKRSELSIETLGFLLGLQIRIREDLCNNGSSNLASELDAKCNELESDLQFLQRELGSLVISLSSRLIHAKSSLSDFTISLENLSLLTSQYDIKTHGARKVRKILTEDLPCIEKELRRIQTLREYSETALKLEALVGDLEDAALCALNQHTGNLSSRSFSNRPNLADFNAKQEKVIQAVKVTNEIVELLLSVRKSHPQWYHLVKAVESRVHKILAALRPQVLADYRNLLTFLGWPPKTLTSQTDAGEVLSIPNPLVLMQGDKKESYSWSFLALCALQYVQLWREEGMLTAFGKRKEHDVGLWAIDELVSPIASRMEHHFLKWIDQPEFIFALIHKITRDFIEGVDDVLQPLIDRARLKSCSAKEAWISAMIQILSGFLSNKVFTVLSGMYKDKDSKVEAISSWLHLTDLIVAFDKQMQKLLGSESYLFLEECEALTTLPKAMSVLSLLCDRSDWLHIWAKVEVKDAWRKLKAKLKDEEAWSTDKKSQVGQGFIRPGQYLLSTREDFRAPLVVEMTLKIVWEMIQRCRTLPPLYRIKFISSSAKKFLWHFFKVLLSRHDRIELPGYNTDESVIVLSGLINAARYCEFKLQEWSDDVNLLELLLAENAEETHTKVDRDESTCFFDEEMKSLNELETNWLMELIAHILRQFENQSFEYFHGAWHFEQALGDFGLVAAVDMTLSDDIAVALDNLRSQLLLVEQHLNPKDFLDLWRSVAEGLDHYIFHSILAGDTRFSEDGRKQLSADLKALSVVFLPFCLRPNAFFPCVSDLLRLLGLDKEELKRLKSMLRVDNVKSKECLLIHRISHISIDQAQIILSKLI